MMMMIRWSLFLWLLLVSPSRQQPEETSHCGVFKRFENSGATGGTVFPGLSSDMECKFACMANPDCIGLDYQARMDSESKCFLHVKEFKLESNWEYVTHYGFTRNKPCLVDCKYAFTVEKNVAEGGGVEQSTAVDLSDCMKFCFDRENCRGFDFSPTNYPGSQCYIFLGNNPQPTFAFDRCFHFLRSMKMDCTKELDTFIIRPDPEPDWSDTKIVSGSDWMRKKLIWVPIALGAWFVMIVVLVYKIAKHMVDKKRWNAAMAMIGMEEQQAIAAAAARPPSPPPPPARPPPPAQAAQYRQAPGYGDYDRGPRRDYYR